MEGSVATAKDGCATQAGPLSYLGATRVLAALVASSLRSAFSFVAERCPLPYFFADDTAASRYDWNMVGEDVSFAFSRLDARGPAGVKHWLEQSPNDE